MYIDPRLEKTARGIDDGKVANGVSRVQANIGAEWDTPFVPGLAVNGRITYTGSQYYQTALPRREIPDWTRVDLGARYTFERAPGQPVTIRFNVDNVFDKNYWASAWYDLAPGAPRTYRLSLSTRF